MEFFNLDNDAIHSKMNEIDNNIQKLEAFHDSITKKESDIKRLSSKLKNKNFFDLKDSVSNLGFQKSIIKNEKNYSKELKRIFIEKIYNELYLLAESILMFVSSIDSIEFDDSNKNSIQKKISKIKPVSYENLNIKNLFHLINCISNNMNLIKQIITLFNKYIIDTQKTIQDNNFHCKTFSTNLLNQNNHITVEYNKYGNQLNKIVEYYHEFSKYIENQVVNHKILEFCINKNV
jgi:hypothetical protein